LLFINFKKELFIKKTPKVDKLTPYISAKTVKITKKEQIK